MSHPAAQCMIKDAAFVLNQGGGVGGAWVRVGTKSREVTTGGIIEKE